MRSIRFRRSISLLVGGLLLVAILLPTPSRAALITLDNGVLKVGVDTNYGGAITYLSLSGTTSNLINSYDLGRQVQQSYYSGPTNFVPAGAIQHPSWSPWPWNPIQVGDVYGKRAAVLVATNTNSVIYVKTIPMQWALSNYPGDCVFEWWLRLEGSAVRAHCKLTNQRLDPTQYGARDQELPAVYGVGTLNHIFTYDGTAPFTSGALSEVTTNGPPWDNWRATENWSAMVNSNSFGIGIHHPECVRNIGGYASSGSPGTGGPSSYNTGYIAPTQIEVLDSNIVYEFDFNLIVGTLTNIRAWVYTNSLDHRPDYHFTSNRQHWAAQNFGDAGIPNGFLRENVNGTDPQLFGPYCAFAASACPKIYFAARYNMTSPPGSPSAQLFWETNNFGSFSGARVQSVAVTPSAGWKIYTFNVGTNLAWTGLISRLRLDPIQSGGSNDTVDIAGITWTNSPPTVSNLTNVTVAVGTTNVSMNFVVGDDLLPADGLQLSMTSSVPSVLPTNNLALSGTGTNRTLSITPLPGQYGNVTVTVTASDTVTNSGQSFTATFLTPWQSWQLANFGSSFASNANALPDADPDGDGSRNLVEYALSLNPNVANTNNLPTLGRTNLGGSNFLTLTFARWTNLTDITYTVLASSNLATWLNGSSYSSSSVVGTNAVTTQTSLTGTNPQSITVRDNTPFSAATNRNLRLRVSQP